MAELQENKNWRLGYTGDDLSVGSVTKLFVKGAKLVHSVGFLGSLIRANGNN